YPGKRNQRQAEDTNCSAEHVATPDVPRKAGPDALEYEDAHDGMVKLAQQVMTAARQDAGPETGVHVQSRAQAAAADELRAEAVTSKLRREPIEDLRLDFEDGFGDQGDEFEDQWVAQAARDAVAGQHETGAPAFYGIRFKCLETPTRARGLRTLDRFLAE